MTFNRFPIKDPRTVARDIPGFFDVIFPQLTQGIVAYFNKGSQHCCEIESVSEDIISTSTLAHAMLFEIAYVRAEQILNNIEVANWENCLTLAVDRQRRHFDAQLPEILSNTDKEIAELVAINLVEMLSKLSSQYPNEMLVLCPEIPGYLWISSGVGDFAIGENLIEVKCTGRNFGSADYRQILMYWLLSYAHSVEHGTSEWKHATLINPRRNKSVTLTFDELIPVISAGKSKVEILELFTSMVSRDLMKSLQPF